MACSKIVNDPIHGHIELPELCVKIMDTPEFQRLRYLRQMGTNYFVYPGASHNRFEHSLGVCHLAGELVKTLQTNQPEFKITERDVLCVQVAGLCHDLGHGAFSHLFEDFMADVKPARRWKHEECSIKMFEHLLNRNDIRLEEYGLETPEDRIFIEELIFGPLEGNKYNGRDGAKTCLYQIVANKATGIDVDKWDYFQRDCQGLGLKSMFQYERLMKTARVIHDDGDGTWKICFRDKAVSDVYEMFHTRDALYRKAVHHKTSVALEQMVLEALLLAHPHITVPGKGGDLKLLSECVDDLTAYTRLTDSVIQTIMTSSLKGLGPAKEILERMEKRKLYRYVGETKPKTDYYWTSTIKRDAEQKIAEMDRDLTTDDFFLCGLKFNYGMKHVDPVRNARFYTKTSPNRAVPIDRDSVSRMLPEHFQDIIIRCYSRKTDVDVCKRVRRCFSEWCGDNSLDFKNGMARN